MHIAPGNIARAFVFTVLLGSLLSAAPVFAQYVPPPTGPATTDNTSYTIYYSTGGAYSWLEEKAPGSSVWRIVSRPGDNGRVDFFGKMPGVYQYRTGWLVNDGRFAYEPMEFWSAAISVTVTGPPIPLDDEFTQLQYDYEVRLGDVNGDGRTDIYVRRLDGDPDNGVVYEAVAYQDNEGYFDIQPNTASILAAGRAYPVANVIVNGGDLDLDGHTDPTILGFPASSGIGYPQTFVSSGTDYDRNARYVVTTDAAVEMFDRDMEEARLDPNYFDNAITPDQPGYRIQIVFEYGVCYWIWGFPFCVTDTAVLLVGEFSLEDLGLSSGSSGGIQKATSLSAVQSQAVSQKAQQEMTAIAGVNLPANPVGTDPQKAAAIAHFGLSNPWPDTLVCVVWCSYYFDGYYFYAWYDVWTPITIPGEFDDVNYSRDAYEAHQGEVELLATLDALALGQAALPTAKSQAEEQADRMRRGWGIPNPFEIIIPPILDKVGQEVEETIEAVKILIARGKIMKECKNAEDPEECIAAMEDEVIAESAEGEAIGGVWTPEEMDEDTATDPDSRTNRQIGIWTVALGAASVPGRWQCSYIKHNFSTGVSYYGITSTKASGNCTDAVDKRDARHERSARFRGKGFSSARLDKPYRSGATLPVGQLLDRHVIRGREQQLIDTHDLFTSNGTRLYGIDARKYDKDASRLYNRIRSVRKRNPLGCLMWEASNVNFGNIAPFTGIESFCIGN